MRGIIEKLVKMYSEIYNLFQESKRSVEVQSKTLQGEKFVESIRKLGCSDLATIVEHELTTVLKETQNSTQLCDNAIQFYEARVFDFCRYSDVCWLCL